MGRIINNACIVYRYHFYDTLFTKFGFLVQMIRLARVFIKYILVDKNDIIYCICISRKNMEIMGYKMWRPNPVKSGIFVSALRVECL